MTDSASARRRLGIILGPILFVVVLAATRDIAPAASRTAAASALMATWWITEALPLAITALIPILLFPLLGILAVGPAAAPYGNPVIFLFLGGFIIARALERCGLHRRFALQTIAWSGGRPGGVLFGFMAATAFISLWVSNTATAAMMYPIALSVIAREEASGTPDPNFSAALLLGVAYASSIGGIGTLIGTPPNALFAGYMAESHGRAIGFGEWMVVGVPIVLIAIPLCWWLLVRQHPFARTVMAGGAGVFRAELASLGPLSRAEWTVGIITAAAAVGWLFRPLLERSVPGLSDTGIAIGAAVLMFLVPVKSGSLDPALRWDEAADLPWPVLILFGGGLSLAQAIGDSGLAEVIGRSLLGLQALPLVGVVLGVTIVVVLLSELASNTATAAVFLPIVGSLAAAMGREPLLLATATTLAASCGFMLPVATPPNALVFGSGKVSVGQMARAGLWLDIVMLVLINIAVLLIVPIAFR